MTGVESIVGLALSLLVTVYLVYAANVLELNLALDRTH
jgi:hypothetical protein